MALRSTIKIMSSTRLFVFDFDHTVVDCNTDTIIYHVLPDKDLPKNIKTLYDGKDWNSFMKNVFDHIHMQGVSKDQIEQCIAQSPMTQGFLELLTFLRANNHHAIIASDSNSAFISNILKRNKLEDVFERVYTNPAEFQGQYLSISPYQLNHGCPKCRRNMCKSKIVEDHVQREAQKGVKFDQVVFLGDGGNDFCPIVKGVVDVAFVRTGFALQKLVKNSQCQKQVHYWSTGNDVLNVIKKWA